MISIIKLLEMSPLTGVGSSRSRQTTEVIRAKEVRLLWGRGSSLWAVGLSSRGSFYSEDSD